eukprot:1332761-Pyramimonas_sp.AAC.1
MASPAKGTNQIQPTYCSGRKQDTSRLPGCKTRRRNQGVCVCARSVLQACSEAMLVAPPARAHQQPSDCVARSVKGRRSVTSSAPLLPGGTHCQSVQRSSGGGGGNKDGGALRSINHPAIYSQRNDHGTT